MTSGESRKLLDDLDGRLLDAVQSEFPVDARPFRVLAEQVASTESEILERVRRLHRDGFIREMGAVFDLRRLGYVSTLCAAQVASDAVQSVAALINSFPEVTHNYLREHAFNIWFTVIARSEADIDRILDRIRAKAGVHQVLSLPQRRMFKIQVHFATHSKPTPKKEAPVNHHKEVGPPTVFADWEIRLLRVLSDPLPLTEQPFADIAQRAEIIEDLALDRIRGWLADGTIRRFGARVAHQAVGYPANGMSVWKTSPDQVESAGKYMAAQPEVSHCYQRDTQPNWDFNLYAMIHGAARADVEAVTRRIADHTRIAEHAILFSSEELKKTAPRYFGESYP